MKNRIQAGLLAGLMALPAAAFAQAPPAPAPTPEKAPAPTSAAKPSTSEITRETARTRATRNSAISTLRKRVDKVEWNEVNFELVIDWLREQGNGSMNVVPVWTPLAVAGVEPGTLVTLSLRNTTVGEALDEVLAQISQDGNVKYRAIGNTLRISTTQDFNRKLYVRVYDVTDLLMRIHDFDDAPEIDLTQLQSQGGGVATTTPPVFSGGGGQGTGEKDETEEEIKERLEELRKLIEETIEPTFWDTGGGPGSIRAYNKMLVVRASVEMHEELAGFFSFQ